MSKYKILWIDDKWEEMDSFKERCEHPKNGMDICPCKYSVEGMELFEAHLEEWAGVILDAKVLMDKTAQIDQLKGLNYSIKKIEQLSSQRKVPYYIFTGQPDTASGTAFAEEHSENYYEKDKDEERLISDIKTNADKMIEIQLLHKYPTIFETWPECHHDLVRILLVLENEDWKNNSVLNDVRKILNDIIVRLYQRGYCTTEPTMSNLSQCSRMVGHPAMEAIIPIYIQRSLHSCVSITNPGSHRSVTDSDVAYGNAPYLVRSLIYDMLNILYWCKNLTSEEDRPLVHAAIEQAIEEYNNNHSTTTL